MGVTGSTWRCKIHKSEWLDQCKRVPVGQTRRVVHGAEGRPNLVLYNNPDSWSAYCHSCKTSGFVRKEYLEPVDTSVPVYKKYLDTRDLVSLGAMSDADFKRLVLLLHDKCMSLPVMSKFNPLYNKGDERLVFRFDGVDIGRDCTGRSPAKWLKYHKEPSKDYVYLQGRICTGYEPVVLVEDLFSAIKINHYTGWSALCCLGTRITDEIIRFITSPSELPISTTGAPQRLHPQERLERIVIAAFDGDLAGRDAERSLVSRLALRGLGYRTVRIPDGLDPKDMRPNELEEMFKFLDAL